MLFCLDIKKKNGSSTEPFPYKEDGLKTGLECISYTCVNKLYNSFAFTTGTKDRHEEK
jgi:hypothetical protein